MKLGILGSGIAGLATAVSLKRVMPDVSYTILEQATEVKEVGAGIGLGDNGVQILERLSLLPHLQKEGTPITTTQIRNRHDKLIKNLPIGSGGYCIHRAALLNMLLKEVDQSNIQLNKKCLHLTEGSLVEVACEDGSIYEFDYVIAADGIQSQARKQLMPDKKLRHSGQTCYRGVSPISLDGKFRSAYMEYIGNNLRFGLADMGSGKAYWYAVEEISTGLEAQVKDTKAHLLGLFSSFPPFINMHISNSPTILKNDMYDLKPSGHKWYTDKICLIGDAAHATTPNLAQGGCQALEDAFTLVTCLSKTKEPKQAFARYQSLRQAKADFVVNQSWRYGQMMHTTSKLKEKLLLKILSWTPDSYFATQLNTINNIDYLNLI